MISVPYYTSSTSVNGNYTQFTTNYKKIHCFVARGLNLLQIVVHDGKHGRFYTFSKSAQHKHLNANGIFLLSTTFHLPITYSVLAIRQKHFLKKL